MFDFLYELTNLGMYTGGDKMRSDYIYKEQFRHILSALTEENRLAIEVSLSTGLRISDVLELRLIQLSPRFTIKERKTGKTKKVVLNNDLLDALLSISGKIFVFEGRTDYRKHRTRQAVYKDIKRATELFRIKNLNISPHSARKIYAVGQYKRTCSISRVQELLNHSDEAVTMLYAMSDELSQRRKTKK